MARKITLLVLPILTAMFLTSSAIWTSHADDKNAGNMERCETRAAAR